MIVVSQQRAPLFNRQLCGAQLMIAYCVALYTYLVPLSFLYGLMI